MIYLSSSRFLDITIISLARYINKSKASTKRVQARMNGSSTPASIALIIE
ncbi:unknown protein, putative [Entamoeba histolytica HM-1:IMSS-A]|uniref:Uncharacterized protein n=1 Tax=Entamoeba histolytica HM-1:IMSS-A TaxID=885318 RepID=N9TLV2_ENTH1|nr:unknown protein, putative [Entamoeba histolytica HM-1:IMSS-A]